MYISINLFICSLSEGHCVIVYVCGVYYDWRIITTLFPTGLVQCDRVRTIAYVMYMLTWTEDGSDEQKDCRGIIGLYRHYRH